MRTMIATLVVLLVAGLEYSCGTSSCGLRIVQHVSFPPLDPKGGSVVTFVDCCGGSVYQDVNLSAGDFEVDLSGTTASNGRVDAFLTSGDCVKLLNGPYTGAVTNPLCTIHIGPVAPGAVSQRKKMTRGRYRLFAQGFTSNEQSTPFFLDMAIWSNACRWNPIAP
jgi:hypothetical protein